jgi:hypothetical protein
MQLYRGTIFRLTFRFDQVETESFMLVEYHESEEYLFQIICISGYKAGTISGYIRSNNLTESKCISEEYLKAEVFRNFLNPDLENMQIVF